jgi:hypothetical protein
MSRGKRILDIGNFIFWIILLMILLMLLPFFKQGFYDDSQIDPWLVQFDTISPKPEPKPEPKPVPENDTVPVVNPDTTSVLKWRDFQGDWHSISYEHPKNALDRAETNRLSGFPGPSIYERMYTHDKEFLQDLIKKMKWQIKHKNLDYMQSLEYVCSSIQFYKYTLINTSREPCPCIMPFGSYDQDCSYKTGRGCCSGVDPFAVYSPFEFIYLHTGDCDTRSLTAFTILKEMGFDVAVMGSNKKSHSVLGVVIPGQMNAGLSMGTNVFGKEYLLWELTSRHWRLGDQVKGTDWIAELE